LAPNLSRHDSAAFLKVVETLGFLGRDAVHITPENFGLFIHCLRMMVEASMDGGKFVLNSPHLRKRKIQLASI